MHWKGRWSLHAMQHTNAAMAHCTLQMTTPQPVRLGRCLLCLCGNKEVVGDYEQPYDSQDKE